MKTLLISSLLLILSTLSLATSAVIGGDPHDFKPCCKDGSSPWASESRDTFKSNALAGYQGSELPPSTGYNPDHLDKYSNPLNSIYNQERSSREADQPRSSRGYGSAPDVTSRGNR